MPLSRLTARERQVADAICRRDAAHRWPTMEFVAKQLGITVATAKAHLRTLAIKLPNPHGLPAQRLVRSFAPAMALGERENRALGAGVPGARSTAA